VSGAKLIILGTKLAIDYRHNDSYLPSVPTVSAQGQSGEVGNRNHRLDCGYRGGSGNLVAVLTWGKSSFRTFR
jgi:hypothetical protein